MVPDLNENKRIENSRMTIEPTIHKKDKLLNTKSP